MSLYIGPNLLNVQYWVNANVNYGLWVIMTWQCQFINCNKYIALVGEVGNGG